MAKKQPSILLSALDNYGGHPFDEVFDVVFPCYGRGDMEGAMELTDRVALIIWGGADISPSIYGHRVSKHTGATDKLSEKDRAEVGMANVALQHGMPVIGICRGAQLMCAMSGGSLIQDVEGHAGGWHKIVTSDGAELNCPSLHHQMMFPWFDKDGKEIEHKMLAWMEKPRGTSYWGQPDEDGTERQVILPGHEPEVVWFPKTKSLCIQSHPEFIHETDHEFVRYCNALVKEYILED